MRSFTEAINSLMHGDNYTGMGNIRSYLAKGLFVNYNSIGKVLLTTAMNNLLIGQAINVLWRQMKVFVLGGATYGDNQGIGNGPPNYNLCRERRHGICIIGMRTM